jgi:hypothetical protein
VVAEAVATFGPSTASLAASGSGSRDGLGEVGPLSEVGAPSEVGALSEVAGADELPFARVRARGASGHERKHHEYAETADVSQAGHLDWS